MREQDHTTGMTARWRPQLGLRLQSPVNRTRAGTSRFATLRALAGLHFDPRVVAAFLSLVQRDA